MTVLSLSTIFILASDIDHSRYPTHINTIRHYSIYFEYIKFVPLELNQFFLHLRLAHPRVTSTVSALFIYPIQAYIYPIYIRHTYTQFTSGIHIPNLHQTYIYPIYIRHTYTQFTYKLSNEIKRNLSYVHTICLIFVVHL